MRQTRVCVFAGPSLPIPERIVAPELVYLPPASRGDIERASREYDAIVLIDGVFHHDIAPSPKEVLQACKALPLFGAASLGALRAAECWPFGMKSLGIIARWYINEIIDGDDEVAVLMHPRTHAALSVPSVNVRYVARLAQRRRLLTTEVARRWVERARTEIFYADRTWENAIDLAPQNARKTLHSLAQYGDLKKLDAIFALNASIRILRRQARAAA